MASSFTVAMAVVDVGIVRMTVHELCMRVLMRVRLNAVPRKIVFMLVMFVMHMTMRVRHWLVGMRVLVTLGEM